MEPWWGLFYLTFLCSLMHIRGQGDFDLADALDDPEPTKEPSSDIYPKPTPPHQPQPGNPDNSGNIYPRPKPPPRPQPGSSDNGAGGDGYPSYGNPQGNRIAKIVSPVLCGVLVTLVGATTSYFRYNRKRNCCRTNVHGPCTVVASPVAEHRLWTRRPSGYGSRAQPLRGMWDLPGPGHEPASPASAGGLSTTAPPGKP